MTRELPWRSAEAHFAVEQKRIEVASLAEVLKFGEVVSPALKHPMIAGGDFATVMAMYQASTSAGGAIANSVTETDLFDSDPVFAINYFYPGRTIYFVLAGGYQTTGTPTLTFRVRGGTGGAGGTLFQTSGVITTSSAVATDQLWMLEYWLHCHTTGSSGTAIGHGNITTWAASGIALSSSSVAAIPATAEGTTIALNTTTTQTIAITQQWGTQSSSNTMTRDAYSVMALN